MPASRCQKNSIFPHQNARQTAPSRSISFGVARVFAPLPAYGLVVTPSKRQPPRLPYYVLEPSVPSPLSGSWILNRIFLFILTLFDSFSPSPSIYFANSPLSLLSFSYSSYDSDKRSQEEDCIPNEINYKYMVKSTRRKSTRSAHPDALQHPDSAAPRTGPLPPP